MARKRSKKITLPPRMEEWIDILGRKAVAIIVTLVLVCVTIMLVKAFLLRSDYFRLRYVEIKEPFLDPKISYAVRAQLTNSYRGKNIFRLNLRGIDKALCTRYPDAKYVGVQLVLPDKLAVRIKFRTAVALLKGARYYPVDEDGVVLSSVDPVVIKTLPVIEGVDIVHDRRNNECATMQNLRLALGLLKEIRRSRVLASFGVSTINAEAAGSLAFKFRQGTEVRIGAENVRERLERLAHMLRDPRMVLDNIKYIDLRFKDVVIGPAD